MKNKNGTTEDMVEYHENGKVAYEFIIYSNKKIEEITLDKHGFPLTFKDSNANDCLWTRDEEGNELAYKNSNGFCKVKGKKATKEEYEAFISELEN